MKSPTLLLKTLFVTACLACGLSSSAYDIEYDGFYFNIIGDNEVEVTYKDTNYNSYSGDLVIPSWVRDDEGHEYDVTAIGASAFKNCSNLTHLTIPTSIKRCTGEPFNGCNQLQFIYTHDLKAWCEIDFGGLGSNNPLNIAHHLFVNGQPIGDAVIPEGTTVISSMAFISCDNLTSITIPNSVTRIEWGSLTACNNLETVRLGNGITEIQDNAFYHSNGIRTIFCDATTPPVINGEDAFSPDVYSNATLIVPEASVSAYQAANYWQNFSNIRARDYDFYADGFYFNIIGDNQVEVTYHDTQYNSYSGNVTVPETVTHDGTTYTVTGIGEKAFMGCQSLAFVSIPATVTYIGEQAFGNSGISSVSIPEGVTAIPNFVFQNCYNLTNVILPESLQSIGLSAFENCRNLSELTIPQNVTSISNMAFHLCSSLIRLTCRATNPPQIQSATFDQWHYETTIVIVPWNSRWDYKEAPYWENFTHYGNTYDFVVDGIYYIIMGVDNGIDIVEVTTGGASNAYSGDLVIPETVTWQGTTYTVVGTNAAAFSNCTNLTSLTLPATTRRCIDSFVDNECTNLTAITCLAITPPTNLTGITAEQYANIVVTVPKNSVAAYQADENWGQFANLNAMTYDIERNNIFYEITGDNEVMVTRKDENSYTYYYNIDIPATITIGYVTYDVTAINERAFYECSNLSAVTLPSSVKTIGDYAFYKCTNLESITLGYVDNIGSYSFAYCSSLDNVKLKGDLQSIEGNSFIYCSSLKKFDHYAVTDNPNLKYSFVNGVIFTHKAADKTLVAYPCGSNTINYTVPSGTVNIGSHAFRGNTTIKTVNMPTSLREIQSFAFSGCTRIENIEVPKGVTNIGIYAFSECTALQQVLLPSTLTNLGGAAFHNDAALTIIKTKAKTPPTCGTSGINPNTYPPFDQTHFTSAMLRVPTGCKTIYKAANIWKLFTYIREDDSLVEPEFTLGDVNGDNQVNITDVTTLISSVMSENTSNINVDAADMNDDGSINITDVTMLINTVMSN